MKRRTNAELVERMKHEITHGFMIIDENGRELTGKQRETALAQTKRWRSTLWGELREIEARLCPKAGSKAD